MCIQITHTHGVVSEVKDRVEMVEEAQIRQDTRKTDNTPTYVFNHFEMTILTALPTQ